MNKKAIERMLPLAIETLKSADGEYRICEDKAATQMLKGYRSAISSFGAAVTMGSFRAAVAFFSKDAEKGKNGEKPVGGSTGTKEGEKKLSVGNKAGDGTVHRSRLLSAMYHIYVCYNTKDKNADKNWKTPGAICELVLKADENELRKLKNGFLHASVALKLAMNAFDLIEIDNSRK